jgi:hypothetical protein
MSLPRSLLWVLFWGLVIGCLGKDTLDPFRCFVYDGVDFTLPDLLLIMFVQDSQDFGLEIEFEFVQIFDDLWTQICTVETKKNGFPNVIDVRMKFFLSRG